MAVFKEQRPWRQAQVLIETRSLIRSFTSNEADEDGHIGRIKVHITLWYNTYNMVDTAAKSGDTNTQHEMSEGNYCAGVPRSIQIRTVRSDSIEPEAIMFC